MKCKICPACNTKNNVDEMICKTCLTSLGDVEEIDCSKTDKNYMSLIYENTKIMINDGDIVGREAKGSDILNNFPTVSRRHAKFEKKGGKWFVIDLETTNGTYVDDVMIEHNKRIEIKNGTRIGLSKRISFEVRI